MGCDFKKSNTDHILNHFNVKQKMNEEKKDEIGESLLEVSLSKIQVNAFQPRKKFVKEELEELAQSILAVGILHPPLVRAIDSETFELISGERRFRAAQLAGLDKIPVIVRRSNQVISAQAALIENIQRVDLNPLEIAKALKLLIEEFGFNQEALASRLGKKRSTIANYLRLLTLPKNIQNHLIDGSISMGHAKAILSLDDSEKQTLLCELVISDMLNVRETEEGARRILEKAKKKQLVYVNRDIYLEHLAEKIQQKLGTKVYIQGKDKKGRILIDYYNLDDLDRLLQIFGIN
jgi:ParB family transcriptional regulator, chromosome partitioning protein